MPVANVNRIVFVNEQSVSQFALSVSQFALSASLLRFGIYSFIIHINLADFYWGRDITDWNRMTDSAVVFRRPITTGEHTLE